jgi:hypothetical protein
LRLNVDIPCCGSCAVKNIHCSRFPTHDIRKQGSRMRIRDLQSTRNRCAGLRIGNDRRRILAAASCALTFGELVYINDGFEHCCPRRRSNKQSVRVKEVCLF